MNDEQQDPCENERQELEEARQKLQAHQANPLNWNTEDEPYQAELRAREEALGQAEENLRICKENAATSD